MRLATLGRTHARGPLPALLSPVLAGGLAALVVLGGLLEGHTLLARRSPESMPRVSRAAGGPGAPARASAGGLPARPSELARRAGDGPAAAGDQFVIAVVDSGVDVNHPDLAGRLWERQEGTFPYAGDGCLSDRFGCAFVTAEASQAGCAYQRNGSGGNVADDNGHGTFVAGVLLRSAEATLRAAGAGAHDEGRVQILPVKVLDCAGEGRASLAAAGVRYAVAAGARVVVLSFAGVVDAPALRAAVDEATQKHGVLVVAAAGNDPLLEGQFPAAYPNVLSVGGTGVVTHGGVVDYGEVAPFSSRDRSVRLLAPAVDIRGPVPPALCGHREWGCADGAPYASASGTSYATPQAAGVAAALMLRYPDLRPAETIEILVASGQPVRGTSARALDIAAAVEAAWSRYGPRTYSSEAAAQE